MKIYKLTNYDGGTKAGWILNDGTICHVPSLRHVGFVEENHSLFKIKDEDIDKSLKDYEKEIRYYQLAWNSGAIRFICTYGQDISIQGMKSSIKKHIEKLHNMARTNNIVEFYISIYNPNSPIQEHKHLNSINELYSFASENKRMYKISDNSSAGWILPDGSIQYVPDFNHIRFIRNNPQLFGLGKEEMGKFINGFIEEQEELYWIAFRKGAVRFVYRDSKIYNKLFDVDGTASAIRRHSDKIHSLANRFGFNGSIGVSLHDSMNGRGSGYRKVSIGDLYSISSSYIPHKTSAISDQARQKINNEHYRLIEERNVDGYDIVLVEVIPLHIFQIGLQQENLDFTDIPSQMQKIKPENPIGGMKAILMDIKGIIDGWKATYGKLYIVSTNEEKQNKFKRILKSIGYVIEEEIIMGKRVFYI